MTDPTIITPDNLPEIGEMVRCVDDSGLPCLVSGRIYVVTTPVSVTKSELQTILENMK